MAYVYRSGTALASDIRETRVPEGAVAIWSLGQAGVVLKVAGETDGMGDAIVVDPYLSRSIEQNSPGTEFVREFPPPLRPEDLAGVAAVLVTHEHDDHLDLATLRPLAEASPETKIGVPVPHVGLLTTGGIDPNAVVLMRVETDVQLGSFHVRPVAVAHTEYRTDAEGNHHYLGYLVEAGGLRVFHSGDTLVTEALVETVRAERPHIVLLPINGRDYERTRRGIVGNMNAREALDFADAVGADLLIPIHFDMFPNNRDNPAYFVDYWFQHRRHVKFHMLAVGERFVYWP
ncbi:MAG: MBL fold metallo-hydrolase [Alicyclobacillus herbarius]|uniref:MBL fold metallo-hydrolase n=1 Tax=Alicyclobacillus herbarius TaxID=122960 RepID=UPI00235481FA|nr:MBL fold metallo-hydrolase [Alicyclobacillus herbarius]MCL6633825.1 MBL fold metallo-hydrolase [Alicyclobacillus herbarius]